MLETPTLTDTSLITALASKKSEITAQISGLKAEITRLVDGLTHIDATISLLSGHGGTVVAQKRAPRQQFFKPNEYKTMILDILRVGSPISTNAITRNIAQENSMEEVNMVLFQKTVLNSLRAMERRGLVRAVGKEGLSILWSVI